MKCSVCAQDVPEERYAEHLAAEHGVTDDPSAVLFEHLTGDRALDDIDDGVEEEEEVEVAPVDEDEEVDEQVEDEEPEEDEFERILAATPSADADDAESEVEPEDEAEPETEQLPEADDFAAFLAANPTLDAVEAARRRREGAAEAPEGAEDEGGGEIDVDALVAAYPSWDVRGGAHDVGTVVLPPTEGETRRRRRGKDAAPAAANVAVAESAVPEGAVAKPEAGKGEAQNQRRWAILGLVAVVILIAAAVIYLLTRDTSSNKTAATSPTTLATPTTEATTILPGAQGGSPTTVAETTIVPTTTAATSPTAVPASPTTTAAGPDPRANIALTFLNGTCTGGQLSVDGTATNNNGLTYSFTFTVQIVNSSGSVVGTASDSIAHLAAHNKVSFTAQGGPGSCTDVSGGHARSQITSITPG